MSPEGRVGIGKPGDPCGRCPLGLMGKGFVRGDGPYPAPILIVGEAPGETEAREGKPFVGPAGRMLDGLLRRSGLERSGFRVANTLCCQPPKNFLVGSPWELDAVSSCYPLLEEEIARTKPKVIIALGNTALKRLTGQSGISRLRGFPIRHPSGAWVMPTYHPSALLPRRKQKSNAKLTGVVRLDLRRAVEMAEKGFVADRSVYLEDPSPNEAAVWATGFESELRQGRAEFLSWDIETPGKLKMADEEDLDSDSEDEDDDRDDSFGSTQILRISFSYRPGDAMSIPWRPEYMPTIQRLLMNPEVSHVTWNGYAFDVPIVAINGIRVLGTIYDGMWAWHQLQSDLPRGLEAVGSVYAPELGPWKHLGASQPAYYNAKDSDAALRNMIGIAKSLKERGQWDLYIKHVVKLYPILFQAGRVNGVLIDKAYQDVLRKELTVERDEFFRQAQRIVPNHFKKQKIYLRAPKDKRTVPVPGKQIIKTCSMCGKKRVTAKHFATGPCSIGAKLVPVEEPVQKFLYQPEFETLSGEALMAAVKMAGFNPVSTKQMLEYARAHAHRVGENYKTGKAQFNKATRAKLVKQYSESHPIYPLSQKLQDLTKAIGQYVDGFAPDRKGKIYTTYTLAASTGRLTSRNKNLQNVSNNVGNNPYAKQIRRQIISGPGKVFIEVDSSAIEAVMVGHFQGDPLYIDLARKGIHDYVTCRERGLEFDVNQLDFYKKDPAYKEARERNKRVIHGTNYGMSPKMMTMQYPDFFKSEASAIQAQKFYLESCPRLGPWQHEIRVTAHRQMFLQNPWGYRHYFYQVFVKGDDGDAIPGPDAKRVVAFLPQSSAAAFMKDNLLIVGASPWAEYMPAIVSIHDSICLEVPVGLAEEATEWLMAVLARPIEELGGLRIGCEAKRGTNWSEMTVIDGVKI